MEFERSLFRVHKRSISICYNYHQNPGRVRVMPVCMRCTELCCMLVSTSVVTKAGLCAHAHAGCAWPCLWRERRASAATAAPVRS